MLYSGITPEKTYWMGADGFTWWVGQVQADGGRKLNKDGTFAEYKDETVSNRVKVRIIGYHSSKFEELPVEDLPWAQVMMPATFPQSSGYGTTHQLALGSWVIGFFMDGLNCQQPIVMGSIGNIDLGVKTKASPGNVLTDNPEQPGFNNILHPLYNSVNAAGGKSDASPPAGINSGPPPTTFGTGFTYKYTPGGTSPLQEKQKGQRQVTVPVANGKCGKETQQKIDETLGDLFRFLKTIKKVNDKYVNVYTKEIVNFTSKLQGFIGRITNIVSDILGSVKTLITNFIRKLVRDLINSILTPNAFCLDVAKELGDALLNSVLCLIDSILQTLASFIENIIVSLVENVINAAFCLVQSVINSLMESISSAVSGVLSTISNVASIIGNGGSLISNLASQLSGFLTTVCSGFGCEIEADRYDVNIGEFLPKSLFGSYGAGQTEAFINTDFLDINAPKIFDSNGNLVTGSLNCSQDNLAFLSCPPQIVLTGLQKTAIPPKLKAVVDTAGRIISTIINDPGFNLNFDASAIVTSCNGFGSGAVVRPIINSNGQLDGIEIDNPGEGYPNYDSSSPDNPRVTASSDPTLVGRLDGLRPTNVGNGYGEPTNQNTNDTIILVNGEPAGIAEVVDGQIVSVQVTADNIILDSYPDIQIVGTGNGARIVPVINFYPRTDISNVITNYEVLDKVDCPGHPNGN